MVWNRVFNQREPFTYEVVKCQDGTGEEFFVFKYWIPEKMVTGRSGLAALYADSLTQKSYIGAFSLGSAYRFETPELAEEAMKSKMEEWKLKSLKSQVKEIS